MKSIVRNNILDKLNLLSRDEKKRQSEFIQKQLQNILSDKNGSWVAYKNLKDEPEIQWDKVSGDIDWVFPKIENNELEFRQSAGKFNKSALGFAEPQDGVKIDLNKVRGFIIPGLAFDKQGHRLGRGKGFYDRALAGYCGPKIGVCFNISLCEDLPHEEHDIKCDQIVTGNQVYKVNKSEGVGKWN